MNQYTIYCTQAQIRKALELGAPVLAQPDALGNRAWLKVTAEQIIGWLRKEKGLFVEPYLNGECCYSFSPIVSTKEDGEIIHLEAEDDPDKATLVAIGAALDYLIQNK